MRSKFFILIVVFATLLTTSVAFAGAIEHRASGGGSLYWEDAGTEYYGFNARKDANGKVTGEVEIHWIIPEGNFHGKVNCLAVDGNTAWLGMVITRTDYPELLPIGTDISWQVQDNGEGINSEPDRQSYFYLTEWLPLLDPEYSSCLDMPDFFGIDDSFEWTAGNVQVK